MAVKGMIFEAVFSYMASSLGVDQAQTPQTNCSKIAKKKTQFLSEELLYLTMS